MFAYLRMGAGTTMRRLYLFAPGPLAVSVSVLVGLKGNRMGVFVRRGGSEVITRSGVRRFKRTAWDGHPDSIPRSAARHRRGGRGVHLHD